MKLKAALGEVLEKLHVGENNFNNNTSATITNNDIVYIRAVGDGSDVDNNDNTQGTVNDTDSELSSLSHVDDPNDVIMVCGVVIAMLLVGLIIVLVAVTINKLRKREETSSASPATNIEAQTTTFATTPANQNHHHQHNNHQHNNYHHQNNNHRNSTSSQCSNSSSQNNQQMFSTSSSTTSFEANHNQNNANMNNNNNNLHLQSSINSNGNCNSNNNGSNGQSVTFVRQSPASNGWVFPPKAPTPNIYNCSNNFDAIVNANDKHGFKGFRKQFSGRFKRLVAKKPAEPAPAIPPELKPQLKTIFVY
ncbi:probable serine/threonine-protein kinase DDB_G0267686 isoform X1 [Eupeodes corollae]|uniref:probable serine/threonine-protein kinase DDB_G0267686 isoform X1 n=1 Tax=Eupeodes corollae TaxID=290404 RepID=UPI00248F4B06|nr:probable serine/threonine-protein kinase DDB_G0267686 isoform X1 [Eupeodes corollae]XP_055908104.1 probable serine/threonine-protein kinase DDB_G0267686 isoform X1 [Eupeodes corollae]XP_055908113.1 probable serine/threonine-protein kinase DDB_G0267686 isoform X1 [Eupeodes corollae]